MPEFRGNPEHLEIIKKGPEYLYVWQHNNPFERIDLSGADLKKVNLNSINLSEANLSRVDLSGASMRYSNFSDADLTEVDLLEADLTGANLSGAKLKAANMIATQLSYAILGGANLTGAHLGGAILRASNFSHANLDDVEFKDALLTGTIFGQTNLSKAKNLNTCRHSSPSIIDFHTLQRSGPLSILFLKGCGLPDNYIKQLNEYYNETYSTIFISYSRKDEDFVNKLQYDLEKVGIICYRDIDHLRGGKEWEEQISSAIEQNDRFLLVGSENSMYNRNVEAETFKAIEIEKKRSVLFPITLTPRDTLKKWNTPLPNGEGDIANSIFKYQIPNFENWHNKNTYQQCLENLIQDLKKDPSRNS